MEDLLQSQIRDSCKLALPEGLRDLMCDISREVLRARPQDLYQFIADYLAAMLVARETLTIAGHVCKDVCECSCEPELDDELRNIGLSHEEAEEAKKFIIPYLEKDKVKEESLLAKLLKTNIDTQKLPDIQRAVKSAYKRKLIHCNRNPFFDGSSSDKDVATRAAEDTLESYWRSGSPDRKSYLSPSETQTPFSDHGARQEMDHQTAEASSTDSSMKDLYVSNNCKPYKNSSLTSLAGSYGIPLITKEQPASTIPKEHLVKSVKNENNLSDFITCKRSQKRQVHINLTDEINESEEIDRVASINEIDEEIVKDDGIEEFDLEEQEEFETIEEVNNAGDESDMSIAEAIVEE